MSFRPFQAGLYGIRASGLMLRGLVPPTPRLAVVGSRAMQQRGREATTRIVELAAAEGFSLVSGGARGIDITAHRHALRIGMPQLVVLPCPPERVYPPEFSACFDEIVERPYSGVLHGLRSGTPASRGSFASRNRLVVGLSRAVVVVQAASRSGSAGTGSLALQTQGKACAALLGSRGCERLVGAGARSLGRPDEPDFEARVRSWLGFVLGRAHAGEPTRPWPEHLSWLCEALEAAPAEGRSLDSFDQPLDALCALTEAVTLSLVVECSTGRYRLA